MVQHFHQDEYGNHLQITGGLPQVRDQITKQWLTVTSLMEQEEDNNQCFQFSCFHLGKKSDTCSGNKFLVGKKFTDLNLFLSKMKF